MTLRDPTEGERELLGILASVPFTGAAEIRSQLEVILVEELDEDGGLRLRPIDPVSAEVRLRVPVEATYLDVDGVRVHLLLHVIDGLLDELEIFREDSQPVHRPAVGVNDLEIDPWFGSGAN